MVWKIRKMRPKIVPIKARKQGSNDPNSSWSQARYAWSCQLLARFGKSRTSEHGPIERRYDGHLQGKLSLDQIVWWDETHRKCLIGSINPDKAFLVIFPRNKEGDVDITSNGQCSKKRLN